MEVRKKFHLLFSFFAKRKEKEERKTNESIRRKLVLKNFLKFGFKFESVSKKKKRKISNLKNFSIRETISKIFLALKRTISYFDEFTFKRVTCYFLGAINPNDAQFGSKDRSEQNYFSSSSSSLHGEMIN